MAIYGREIQQPIVRETQWFLILQPTTHIMRQSRGLLLCLVDLLQNFMKHITRLFLLKMGTLSASSSINCIIT